MQEIHSLVSDLRSRISSASGALDRPAPHRFELFHSALSVCAQKVRVVFAYHDLPYIEHGMDVFRGDNFLPSHVALRLMGCAQIGAPLARTHNGSTSVTSVGCDACVVPTLIDWQANEVLVDSKRICLYLDEQAERRPKLMPTDIAGDIDLELSLVDDFPNVQMLLENAPGARATTHSRGGVSGAGFAMSRIKLCERFMAEVADDQALVDAYSAKIAKERYAAEHIYSADAVEAAYVHAEKACERLEAKLERRGSTWLFGENLTLADIFWSVELLRLKNLGTATFWADGRLPQVARYLDAAENLPSIKTAILNWKGALL